MHNPRAETTQFSEWLAAGAKAWAADRPLWWETHVCCVVCFSGDGCAVGG